MIARLWWLDKELTGAGICVLFSRWTMCAKSCRVTRTRSGAHPAVETPVPGPEETCDCPRYPFSKEEIVVLIEKMGLRGSHTELAVQSGVREVMFKTVCLD